VQALAFSPDGQWIAAGRFDGSYSLYNALNGQPRRMANIDKDPR